MTEKIASEREIQNEWKWKTKKKGKTHEKNVKEKNTERERWNDGVLRNRPTEKDR